jgi:hypothetical protein
LLPEWPCATSLNGARKVTPTQNAAAGIAESREALPGELRGRRLFHARALWVGIVSLTALLFIASFPAHLVDLHRVCAAEPCIAGQLAPAEMRALGYLGVSTYVSLLVSGLFFVPDYLFVEGKTPTWISLLADLVLFSFAGIPTAIGFAVLKYRLYDIDIISTAPSSTVS